MIRLALTTSMICHACGAESSASTVHCPNCGAALGPGGAAVTRLNGAVTRVSAVDPASSAVAPAGNGAATSPPLRPFEDPRFAVTIGSSPTGGVVDAVLPSDSATFTPGHAFGPRYRIEQLLGVGGMGAVYRARDAELAVDVALKVVRPEIAADPAAAKDLQQRFKRELLLARQVTHKNVVRIHDIGEVDGIKYITMPFIEGEDLIAILKREGRLPVERALKILRGALAGLVAAHAAGVVHRDLKPANVMVTADDEALIMDFGIARLSDPTEASAAPGAKPGGGPSAGSTAFLRESMAADARTQLGTVMGTIEYMAPEQAAGILVDQRADVYALGMIVHEMLSGLRNFGTTGEALADLTSRRKTPPPLLRSLNDAVPETVERMVAKCLRPSADERYQTSAELAAELDQLDDRGVPLPRPQKLLRSPKFWVAASVVVGTLLGATWWAAVKLGTPLPQAVHAPVSVLIADVENKTGDAVFEGAFEETLKRAIEGASFIDVYPRQTAATLAGKLKPGAGLSEETGRLVARSEGIHVLMIGSVGRQGAEYAVSVRALESVS